MKFIQRGQFYLSAVIPIASTNSLASVLILSLAWREVLVKASIIQQNPRRRIATSSTTHKTAVGFAMFLVYFGGGTLLYLGYRAFSSGLASFVFGVSGVYFMKNANKFNEATAGLVRVISERNLITAATGSEPQSDEESLAQVRLGLAAARAASRRAGAAMLTVVFSALGYSVMRAVVGNPSRTGQIAVPGYFSSGISIGNSLMALSTIRYASHARLISQRQLGVHSGKIAPDEDYMAGTSSFV
jgi:hypothetical protein